MKQQTISDIEYASRKKITKREAFLDAMNEIIPWSHWIKMITPYYPKGKRGRPPLGIALMLRMYLLQIWFSLSDEGIEDAIYDSYAFRKFSQIDFFSQQVPDATTLLHFRHLLEEHELGEKLFEDIKNRLESAGLMMHGGSIVDATIISAPSSTKNREGKRDPEMHQTKKGNEWRFGMKIHSGVDAGRVCKFISVNGIMLLLFGKDMNAAKQGNVGGQPDAGRALNAEPAGRSLPVFITAVRPKRINSGSLRRCVPVAQV
jgi:IS5 family transposase